MQSREVECSMQRAEALVAAVVVVVVEDYRPMGFTPLKKLQRAAGLLRD